MNAISSIRQWCSDNGYAFTYGNPMHVNEWMNGTDFSSSTDGTAVFCHLLTASDYDGSRDTYNVGVYFATLVDFDFDNNTIDATTEALKERAKTLLHDLQSGNEVGWSGARFQYGYDDYAENVCWCCLRVTLTALAADCVETQFPTAIIELPQAAESFLNLMGVNNITLTNWAAHGTKDGDIWIRISLVCLKDINAGDTVPMEATLNGVDLSTGYDYSVISQPMADMRPELQPYVGFWLVEYNVTTDYSETFTMTAKLGDWWDGGTITW